MEVVTFQQAIPGLWSNDSILCHQMPERRDIVFWLAACPDVDPSTVSKPHFPFAAVDVDPARPPDGLDAGQISGDFRYPMSADDALAKQVGHGASKKKEIFIKALSSNVMIDFDVFSVYDM